MADSPLYQVPPINEVGLSVSLSTRGVYDPYDVIGLHRSFGDLPHSELQTSLMAQSVAPLIGGGSDVLADLPRAPQRWWFTSVDESRVLQIQDDIIALNWRRGDALPGEDVDYPGYLALRADLQSRVDQIRSWNESMGRVMPDPAGCELYYDDVIRLEFDDGTKFSMSETLREVTRVTPRAVRGWQMGWNEKIDDLPGSRELLDVQIRHLGMAVEGRAEPISVLRTVFTAGAARRTWDEVFDFFDASHNHISRRFHDLIEERVKATWRPS